MKQLRKIIFVCAVLVGLAAAGAASAAPASAGHAEAGRPLVSADAPTLFHVGPLPVTNAMVFTWIVGAVIFLIIRIGTHRMQEVPAGTQNFVETTVEGLEGLAAGILEPKVTRWAFPLVATYFIFILASNLTGLLPGVGSIGWGHPSGAPLGVEHADIPLLRPPTADANTTVAMAAIFLVMNVYWAIRYNGPMGFIKHIFGVKVETNKWAFPPLLLIFIFIGLTELVSIFFVRPVALAMRLYGNIYGGENVLTMMLTNSPLGLAAVPFYFLELLVAIVQALVFTVLSISFIGILCSHTEEEGAAPGH
ncbi:MAG TPA: F0F1 ATP synthase subunit A [Candidatus Acidoferrum sp.]|nr:F0F1 ATP synthase subunit A [Candidatus Acidoferrum sp.]